MLCMQISLEASRAPQHTASQLRNVLCCKSVQHWRAACELQQKVPDSPVCSLQNNEVVAALVDLFRQFEVREEKQVAGHHAVVDPTPLREALGNLPDSRFKVGESSGFTSLC